MAIVRCENTGEVLGITCDTCKTPAPKIAPSLTGLNGIGWRCSGGRHECPDCKSDD